MLPIRAQPRTPARHDITITTIPLLFSKRSGKLHLLPHHRATISHLMPSLSRICNNLRDWELWSATAEATERSARALTDVSHWKTNRVARVAYRFAIPLFRFPVLFASNNRVLSGIIVSVSEERMRRPRRLPSPVGTRPPGRGIFIDHGSVRNLGNQRLVVRIRNNGLYKSVAVTSEWLMAVRMPAVVVRLLEIVTAGQCRRDRCAADALTYWVKCNANCQPDRLVQGSRK